MLYYCSSCICLSYWFYRPLPPMFKKHSTVWYPDVLIFIVTGNYLKKNLPGTRGLCPSCPPHRHATEWTCARVRACRRSARILACSSTASTVTTWSRESSATAGWSPPPAACPYTSSSGPRSQLTPRLYIAMQCNAMQRNAAQRNATQYSTIQFNTHTHPFNGPLSRTIQVSRYQKEKTNLGHMQVSTTLCTTQFFTGLMPFLPPNQQRQSTEGLQCNTIRYNTTQ